MKVKIAYVEDLKPLSITYSEQKVICPFCKSEVIPILKVLMTDYNVNGGNLRFLAKFPCCNKEHFVNCDKGDYYYENGVSTRSDAKWTSEELPKVSPNLKDFPEIIDEISPSFRHIYEEAQAEEQLG